MRCLVVEPFHDAIAGVDRAPGEFVEILEQDRRDRWTDSGLVKPIGREGGPEWPWEAAGRELREPPLSPDVPRRVVACLNVWNDRPALQATMPTWLHEVDAILAVDGAYEGVPTVGGAASQDGTLDLIRGAGKPYLIIGRKHDASPWPDQIAKRNAYLRSSFLRAGDLLFVIDADEAAEFGEPLALFSGEVGWVRIRYEQYRRSYDQPRLFRWSPGLEYRGRHHWVWNGPSLVATHQYGGPNVEHRLAWVRLTNAPDELRPTERRMARMAHRLVQAQTENREQALTLSDRVHTGARESLRILHLCDIDPGLVIYRLHTAINATTPHASVFARQATNNPYAGPLQFDLTADRAAVRLAAREADVVHCHLGYHELDALGVDGPRAVVMHHHGTSYRSSAAFRNDQDAQRAGLRLVSNLELLQYGEGLHFLPNPVPVARYRHLAAVLPKRAQTHEPRGFWVAHSPSKRQLKGTEAFLRACERLRARGVPVYPLLIEGLPHGEALRLKATADATFDSFWLGMQCSGIEAAAMGQPVIAGDGGLEGRAEQFYGEVPWTLAPTPAALETALERLAMDPGFRQAEASRVYTHVVAHHDEAAVALRYLDLLDEAFEWRRAKTLAPTSPADPTWQPRLYGGPGA